MTINASNIKLLKSERMSDATDGGGRMTSQEIVSGELSNIFPKVSRTDAVYGRVNLRKIYAAVQSATLDLYGGAHAIIVDAPDDDRINAVLFSTSSSFDTRAAARNKIESYVVSGGISTMRLYSTQIVGAKAITVYQRVEEALPDAGEVYQLSTESGQTVTAYQYVRITEYTHEVRTFTDASGDFQRRVLVLKISAPLESTYVGAEPVRTDDPSTTKVRTTLVADASKYYGIQPLKYAAEQNTPEITLEGVYAHIVPSTNREFAISMATIGGAGPAIACGVELDQVSINYNGAAAISYPPLVIGLLRPAASLSLNINTVNAGAIAPGETLIWGANSHTLSPDGLQLSYTGSNNFSYYDLLYTPSAEVTLPSHTRSTEINLSTRGTVYVETLHPLPARNTVQVDYRALGKWYRVRDDGNGVLVADSLAIGAGTINYNTGALVVTLGALPDMESAILYAWASPTHTVVRAGATADAGTSIKQTLDLALNTLPIAANSLSFSYVVAGATRTLTDDATGVITGTGATGSVDYSTGRVEINYTDKIPDAGSVVTVAYNHLTSTTPGAPILQSTQVTCAGSAYDISAAEGFVGIEPGTLRGTVTVAYVSQISKFYDKERTSVTVQVLDDGAGNIKTATDYQYSNTGIAAGQILGFINYNTGVITATPAIAVCAMWGWVSFGGASLTREWVTYNESAAVVNGTAGSFVWGIAGSTTQTEAVSVTYPVDGSAGDVVRPTLDLCKTTTQAIVPGSVIFKIAGRYYWDDNGTLYSRVVMTNLDNIAVGAIDYSAGTATLDYWNNNTALALSVMSCLTAYGEWTATEAFFRTAGSPLRPGSFFIQVTAANGELLSATTDTNGAVSGDNITGQVNQTMGVVDLRFGEMVTAAGMVNEDWYNAADVVGGMIWRPRDVIPSTLRYSAVILTNLPLDPTLLGLDPVRLPSDGRVPIYRPGDIVVLHHTATTTLTNPVTPGQSYALGRVDLATVSLADSNGLDVTADKWTANLAAGTVTIAANASLAAYTQPLIVSHRIEQMNLCTDAQASGGVSLSAPTNRAFPLGSLLSSCLPFGDLYARVSNVFDLATFATWSDTPGTGATAQYNDVSYPIEVLNEGAVTERWRISFTSTTAFAVIGENAGQIATGTTAADISITNSLTGKAYFVLRAAGWGAGWATGNQLRFNTYGANAPIWIARTILGGASLNGDALTVEVRGDTD